MESRADVSGSSPSPSTVSEDHSRLSGHCVRGLEAHDAHNATTADILSSLDSAVCDILAVPLPHLHPHQCDPQVCPVSDCRIYLRLRLLHVSGSVIPPPASHVTRPLNHSHAPPDLSSRDQLCSCAATNRSSITPADTRRPPPPQAAGQPRPPPAALDNVSRQIQLWVKGNYDSAMRFVAYAELAILARVVIGALT